MMPTGWLLPPYIETDRAKKKRRRKGPNTMMIRATGSTKALGTCQGANTNEELPGKHKLSGGFFSPRVWIFSAPHTVDGCGFETPQKKVDYLWESLILSQAVSLNCHLTGK
jgi:hypothetical protein